jgi:hydrogenase nickel insertion protein HypA
LHEFSIAEGIVDAVLEKTAGRKPVKISLIVGAFSSVVEDSLRFYIDLILEDRGLKDVEVAVRPVPAEATCACGNRYPVSRFTQSCPKCGGHDRKLEGGKECIIESAEVEDA